MNLDEMIGHHLMIGVPGTSVMPAMIKQFRETHAAGFIVFRPNFKSAAAFTKLLSDLNQSLGRKLLTAVDHEGGRVIHLAEGVTVFPDNWMIGNTGEVSYARQQGAIEGAELRRLGIDLNLAPTLDVLRENYSPNIGIRSYGKNPRLVAKFGAERIKAMQKAGVSACAKHFPGLGAAALDPHFDLPTLGMSWQELREVHLKPFISAIRAGVDCVMSSHPVYPKLDSSKVPATFSRKLIYGLLRKELGFRGVILSDDLEMGALRGICSIGEAAVRAVHAGHDMVLVCHDLKAQREVFQSLRQSYQSGRLKLRDLHASVERIQALIQKRKSQTAAGKPKAAPRGARLAEQMAREGVRGYSGAVADKNGEVVDVVFPDFSELANKFFVEPELLAPQFFLKRAFSRGGFRVQRFTKIPLLPKAAEVKHFERQEGNGAFTVLFCWDAHACPEIRRILEFLKKRGRAAVVLLRDPYDLDFVKGELPTAVAFGFRKVQIEAAVKALIGILK